VRRGGSSSLSRGTEPTLADLYGSAEFQLASDNDLTFHIAQAVLALRRSRGLSQAALAKKVGTSQARIARVEMAADNITVRTIERLAQALGGRLSFGMAPAEREVPRLPAWWHMPQLPSTGYALSLLAMTDEATPRFAAGWTARVDERLDVGLVSLARETGVASYGFGGASADPTA